MALTRKFLATLGIEADKIDEIIGAHSETVEALKEEREKLRIDAEKYTTTKEELDKANEKLKDYAKEDSFKVKYEALKEDFDNYKKEIQTEKSNTDKRSAYRALLKEIGVADKRIDAIAKLVDLEKIKLDKDGKIEGAEDLKKSLSEEWADFIVKSGTQGAATATPPSGEGSVVKTKEEIMKIKDTTERQKAWADLIRQGGN